MQFRITISRQQSLGGSEVTLELPRSYTDTFNRKRQSIYSLTLRSGEERIKLRVTSLTMNGITAVRAVDIRACTHGPEYLQITMVPPSIRFTYAPLQHIVYNQVTNLKDTEIGR